MTATSDTPPRRTRLSPAARRKVLPYALLIPGLVWLGIFYLIPMIQLVGVSLEEGSFEQGYELTWRWANYSDSLSSFGGHFVRSFTYAGIATVLALAISYPLAYAIAFRGGKYKNLLVVMVLMPFLVPFLLRTLAWKTILADAGPVVGFLQDVGLLAENGRLLATSIAVVAGITYNFLAFMTLPIYVSLEKIDRSLIEAANDLYAHPFTAFRKVTLPLSLPGIVGGTLLTFIPAAGDFINAQLLGGPNQLMVGNVIDSRFLRIVDYPTAAALSFVLMLAIVTLIVPYVRATGSEDLVA